jgi:hypothetical protein
MSRHFPFLTAFCVGLLVGAGYPLVDLALSCRVPTSEACVWGKAYFPLTMSVSVLVLGGIVTGFVYAALLWRRRQGARIARQK